MREEKPAETQAEKERDAALALCAALKAGVSNAHVEMAFWNLTRDGLPVFSPKDRSSA